MAPVLSLFFFGMGLDTSEAQTEALPVKEDSEAEVMTRGPVHEAFAETLQLNPQPGVVVTTQPPAPVEELAPEQKPEGENVVWIPGYWAWDDEQSRFFWVSGTWRNTPPGRRWVPGFWNPVAGGHQWVSGYWAPVQQEAARTEYLPEPPASLEYGPPVAAPSAEYIWVPGSWIWQGRYVWRPGYWVAGRPDLCWIPASYAWTPGGYVYVEGYWDYPIADRGILFAPVYWEPSVVYVREVRYYSPVVVINLTFLSDCLFVRPRYHHYYFGDYYDPDCRRRGYFTAHAWYERNRGCEPVYAHRRWEHRNDRDWDRRQRARDDHRRDHPESRPPRRYASNQEGKGASFTTASQETVAVAAPLADAFTSGKKGAGEPKLKKLGKSEREAVTEQAELAVKQAREERKTAQKAAEDLEKSGKAAWKEQKKQEAGFAEKEPSNGRAKEAKPQRIENAEVDERRASVENGSIRQEKVKEEKTEKSSRDKSRNPSPASGSGYYVGVQDEPKEKVEKKTGGENRRDQAPPSYQRPSYGNVSSVPYSKEKAPQQNRSMREEKAPKMEKPKEYKRAPAPQVLSEEGKDKKEKKSKS